MASACVLSELTNTCHGSEHMVEHGNPVRLVVLASGEGSNLQALIDAIAYGQLRAQIVKVCSDKPGCGALQRAEAAGIATWARSPREFSSRADFDEALFSAVADVQPGLIVCAGYMRLISAFAVERHPGQMINIHPSLLPTYPGLDTHARALADAATEHGATVHFVTAALDAGPAIAQARVAVVTGDTPASLSARVRAREHPLLVSVVKLLADRRVDMRDTSAWLDGQPLAHPLQLRDDDSLSREGLTLNA